MLDSSVIGKIQEHDVQDIYRVESGTLIYVNKFKSFHEEYISISDSVTKEKTKIVRGCKNLREFKEDYVYIHWRTKEEILIPKGTYMFEGHLIKLETNPKKYKFKLSTTNMYSEQEDFLDILSQVKNIVMKY